MVKNIAMIRRFFDDKKEKSFEGKYYSEINKSYDLVLHSRNIRDYEPTNKMIELMREYGFVNEKPVIIVYENDKPAIVNGNQRKKCADIV
ncbi:MAG: hypothetical protein ACFFDK_18600, partial [Promethearchaeota archaeon]